MNDFRLAVISDIHGNVVALEAVLSDLRRRGAEAVINLGDCATSPLWPRETMELLETLDWPTVRGNHDRWIATAPFEKMSASEQYTFEQLGEARRAALGDLPALLEPFDDVLAVHGTRENDAAYLLEERVNGRLLPVNREELCRRLEGVEKGLVLCGHSHHQHTAAGPGRSLVLNPGSVGCPRYADNEVPAEAESCSPHARYAIATRRFGRWSVEMFVLDYDWSLVVDRARANGREDWARGFLQET